MWSGLAPREKSGFSRIFFLETGGRGALTARIACAVESAARLHPRWTVHLLSAVSSSTNSITSGSFVEVLRSIPNVVLSDIKPKEEFEGTPLQPWYESGALGKSSHPVEHLADALRLAVLYKRGGIYIDIDIIMMRPLDSLPPCVCQSPVEGGDMVSNGFMAFHRGDPFLVKLMKRAAVEYRPEEWASIGPVLLRRVALAHCGRLHVKELVGRRCGGDAGFTVVPYWTFLPVPYDQWQVFFAANTSEEAWLMCTASYVMHVYNKMSSRVPAEPGSAYRQAAQAYCPESLRLSLNLSGNF
ncbi:lactosylceramide 4-alpha-galactosyltransferase-like [Amblyomma americanum]